MASVFYFSEDNGAATGSPPKGTTRTPNRSECNWKNVDDSTTAYSSSPITAGNASYHKYQFGVFSGTYNQILDGLWQHTSGTLGAGLTLRTYVTTSYATPSTTASGAWVDFTPTGNISTGLAVLFGATGPEAAGKASSTTSNPAFSQYLATQLITTVAAAAGDTDTVGLTLQYSEN